MRKEGQFRIALFGFTRDERRALTSLFALTVQRRRAYSVVENANASNSDIVLIDADDRDAVAEWKASANGKRRAPVVMVGKAPPPHSDLCYISRPMSRTRLLTALDEITIKVLRYVPELVVGSGQEHERATRDALRTAEEGARQAVVTGHTVLVCDDSRSVRKMMEIELRLLGIGVHMATTGEQALELAGANLYDVIFMDLVLPGMDGYKVCKSLRKSGKSAGSGKNRRTPIIMLTGKDSTFDKLRGTMAGCSLYLTKPVQQNELLAALIRFFPRLAPPARAHA